MTAIKSPTGHPDGMSSSSGPVTKRTDVRALITVVAAFAVWRIGVELIPMAIALVLALGAAAAVWFATGRSAQPRQRETEQAPPQ